MNKRLTPILIITSAFWLFGLSAKAQNGPTIGGSVYGGGNKAAVTGTVTVDISAGEVKKNVFGGGNEAGISNHNEQTDGTATVTVANATVGSAEGSYGIYGGCNTNGTVAGDVEVRIKAGTFGSSTKHLKGIYGGGFGANTETSEDVTVTIGYENTTPTVYGDVYGGSALGKVNDASAANPNLTKVDVKGGTVNGTVYGGGMGDGSTAALVNGNVEVAVNANVTQGVYGGCNINGIVKGGSTVGITAGTIGHVGDYGAAYGGGLGENTKVKGNVVVNVNGASASITGDVYGGSAQGLVNCNDSGNGVNGSANTQVTLTNGTITGNLYGGGHGLDNKAANVWGPVTVNVNGGSVANVFGCNNLNGAPQGDVTVTVEKVNNATWSVGNVYGGGNVAAYGGTPAVNIKAGTVSGNVYGGGNNITSDSQTNPAGVLGSNVEMTGGTVLGSIYGGCNQKGTVTSNSVVNIVGGIIGSQNLLNAGTVSQVFGGGLGESTNVNGNVTVTISKASGDNAPAAPTIYGDVYGGSALGAVNDAASDKTTVHILDGTLVSNTGTDANGFTTYTGGNVFGGGLGESGPDNVNKGKVNGKVEVNIGSFTANAVALTEGDHTGNSYSGSAIIGGCVYGCNNTNGSPQQDVTVNVYKTAHTDANAFSGSGYAIANVFGGGNLANYTASGKKATVNIFSCDNTIGRTFGGGNAAATPNVETQIKGGRIGQVFGGGNGEVSAANINGTVLLGIHGGDVGQTFGGSNTSGNISGEITIVVDETGCGSLDIDEFFCGGNFANIYGGLTTDITCSQGMSVKNIYGGCNMADIYGDVVLNLYGGVFEENVFGGSKGRLADNTATPPVSAKAANILKYPSDWETNTNYPPALKTYMLENGGNSLVGTGGNVTLNLYGGTMTNAFGGSNVNGNIEGRIVVNVLDYDNSCGLDVTNIYGASNETNYEPTDPDLISPIINIMHINNVDLVGGQQVMKGIRGNVFGGGNKAAVTANPVVNIGYAADTIVYDNVKMADLRPNNYPTNLPNFPNAYITGDVFGGGNLAGVTGTATVNMRESTSFANSLFGGGNKAGTTGTEVNVYNGTLNTAVYGGCNEEGTVSGDIDVNIKSSLGAQSNALAEGIYGGGKGNATQTTGDVTVTIGDNSTTTPSAPTIYSDVYGGSAFGQVGASGTTTSVNLQNGTINGVLYGGGMGCVVDANHTTAYSAQVSGNTQVSVNGAVTGGVYGGCNVNGTVAGGATVGINGGTIGHITNGNDVYGAVYGGGLGENTKVKGNVIVNVNGASASITGDVYGGSAQGLVNCNDAGNGVNGSANTQVTLTNGTITGNLYGGGHGLDSKAANVWGPVTVNVNGGSVANIFGCNNAAGAPKSTVQVNVEKSNASGAPALNISQNVYGGGNQAAYTYTCAQDEFSPEVNIKNGAITGNVFGGGLGAPAKVCSNPKVTFGSTTSGYSASAVSVYGGGSAAEVGNSTTSAVNNAEVLVQANGSATKVFGGGMAAGVTGTTAVTISGGAVTSGVYGGCDSEGTVGSTATVQINGGTIGTENNINGVVYGGGLGENTVVNGSVAVNIGSAVGATPNATIHGDVYGGSAMGLVNCTVNGTTQTPVNNTTTGVTLNAGTINGDLYGGGHGLQSKAANVWGDVTVTINGGSINTFTVRSNTYGGQVFGCNNLNGTPKKDVEVHIYGTNHGADPEHNLYPTLETGQTWNATTLAENTNLPQAFAIAAVYGGGNKAAFIPMAAGTGEDPHSATVHVHDCFNTIEDIFGGGNAADVGSTGTGAVTANTNVIIEGGRIKHVFGGGNGAGDNNPGANIYGTATTTLYAGVINQVFGGSNERGDITEANLNLDHDENNTCDVFYGEVFGGGNMALINGSLVTNVFCGAGSFGDFYGGANEADITGDVTLNVFGGTFNNVFGGSKGKTPQSGATAAQVAAASADIGGNVTLNLYGGTINQAAYGGSDVFGNIGGMITVNVLDLNKSCGVLSVSNVYGGGRNAFYTPTYTPTGAERVSPMVNLIHGTVTNVFGGAYGSGAAVNASPRINIGYDANTMSGLIPTNLPTGYTLPASYAATVTNNVYGGGDLAEVAGNTTVNHNAGSVASLFGGGNKASVGGATVNVLGGSVSTGVYGGCNESGYVGGNITTYSIPSGSTVTPAIVSTLGTIEVNVQGNLGSSGTALTEGVYGGGKGGYVDNNNPGTHTSGTVTVNIGNGTNAPVLYSDVYGGSAFGQVASDDKLTKVDLKSGTINGTLYGGGKGQLASTNPVATAFEAEVTGNTQVLVNGSVTGGVYGGCNVNGTVAGGATVGINGGTIGHITNGNDVYGAVYGGGLGENTKVKGNVIVNVNGASASITGDVYGGSAQGLVNCNDAGNGVNGSANTQVTLTNGTITGNLYGGGHGLGNTEAHVWGPVVVTVNNGTANNVFGGNNLKGSPQNTVQVDVKGGTIINNVYGGGNQADYTGGSPIVNIQGGTVHQNVFGGGNEAGVGLAAGTSTTQVNVSSGTVGDAATDTYGIYGGCNTSGTVKGHVKLNITGGTLGSNASGSSYRLKGIYGGGLGENTVVNGNVAVAIGADVYGDVYGGSAKGLVNCTYNTTTSAYEHTANDTTGVTLNSGAVTGDIYGGGHGLESKNAHVYGPVTVAIKAGSVKNVFGCNNLKGAPQNGTLVNITGGTVSQDVYGGGNLANASSTATHVIVNGGTVSQDVYGGGAFAHTGATTVDILSGTVTGNVYGGALGGSGYTPEVNGTVTVNIGSGTMDPQHSGFTSVTSGTAIIGGSVYGCNNAAGSPKDNVTVNVYSTDHPAGTGVNENGFAIANVFGGGNMANFVEQGKTATVNIYGCDNTIGRTFGGGDAASTNTVNTMIQGGHIGTVFGGGNGETGTAANVYGDVNLAIHGGHVGQFFGGSNRTGTISGDINLVVDDISPCPDHLEIDEFFCGGNFADVIGGLSTDITCSEGMKVNNLYGGCNMAVIWGDVVLNLYGGEYKNVFGGSKGDLAILTTQGDTHIDKAADIKKFPATMPANTSPLYPYLSTHQTQLGKGGNVTLNLYGGKVTENVFGGSNVNGNIEGVITVNVLDYESTQCPLNIQNIYGSGNLTAYTPNDVDTDVKPTSPVINVMHVKAGSTIGGSIFGGAKGGMIGETELLATVTSNPKVNIGYDSEAMTIPTGYTGPAATSFKANVTGSIYGGGDLAPVVGSTTVILRENAATTAVTSVGGNVFGGGNLANVSGSTTVDVTGGTVTHDVYGGGALANTQGSTVTLTNGMVNDIYGGGLGRAAATGVEPIAAQVTGPVSVTVNGGTVHDVYGANNVYGGPTNTVQVNINSSVTNNVYGGGNQAAFTGSPKVYVNHGTVANVFGGGKGDPTGDGTTAMVTGAPEVTIGDATESHCAVVSNNVYGGGDAAKVTGNTKVTYNDNNSSSTVAQLFGGGNAAGVTGTTEVNMNQGKVTSGVFGGCNSKGTVGGAISVNIKGGTLGANGATLAEGIYGGGYGKDTETGDNVTVTIGYGGTAPAIYGDVYGGSALGKVGVSSKLTKVDFLNGTLNGTLYGGGKGQTGNTPVSAEVKGDVQVAIANGSISGGVYGGCNLNGDVKGDITVGIAKGSIGTSTSARANVHGGGLGAATTTKGAVTVNIASNNATEGPTIYGDLYGGSGFGQVSASGKLTKVNFYKGTINGDIYGGGLGSNEHSAEVSGNVEVNICGGVFNSTTGTAGGSQIFGCNNAKGTPKGDVAVHIYGTDHGADPAHNKYPTGITTAAQLATNANTQTYAIAAVYGGGNLASYEPAADKSTTVYVHNCDNTIKDVFGGGNAANVGTQSVNTNTYITIDGGRINRVFGGGNGQTSAANINGTATTTINAGLIDQIFGGGNVSGTISNTSLNLAKSGSCTDEVFREVFGGANLAPIAGVVNTTINCGVGTIGEIYGGSNLARIGTEGTTDATVNLTINGGDYQYVFGGSKGANNNPANIYGHVNLNLHGGTIANAFGGSNVEGNVSGKITVDVLDNEGTCPLILTNVYGGGNLAYYRPSSATLASPEVNIKHIKQGNSVTNVYGGGYGSSAEVKACPKVTIGDTESTHYATISNNVYGGGEQAPVTGSPTVIIQNTNSSVKNIFGGGNLADVSAGTIVNLNGGTVSQDVYGGGALANTGGSTVTLAGGTVTQDIYGGGLGRAAATGVDPIAAQVTGPVHVSVNSGNVRDVYGCNNINGSPTNTTVQVDINGLVGNNVYGGGNLATSSVTPIVNIKTGADVTGSVFGGGNNASVAGGDVNMQAGIIHGGLYGGCNTSGTSGNITVDVTGGTIGASGTPANVHGGGYGNGTATTGDVEVTINGSTAVIWGDVYGGSAKGHVNDAAADHTYVTLTSGTIHGDLYGGGLGDASNAASVNGAVQVTVNGGTVTGSVYGCNNANGAPQSTVKVDVYGTDDASGSNYALANVFGGGNQAAYGGSPEVTVHNCNNSIGYLYGGGNKASVAATNVKVYGGNTIGYVFGGGNGQGVATDYTMVSGNAVTNIYGGTIGHVFGGNNSSGAITGMVTVNVDKQTESGHNSCDMKIGEVYGGGNLAAGNAGTITIGCTGTWTNNHNSHNNTNNRIGYELEGIGTVYGGANQANVNNGIDLNIVNGIVENVFGGNNTSGSVNDTIRVTINKGSGCDWYVGNVYGGGNLAQYGAPNGKPNYPKVRILNGTVSGDVFGGGLGQSGDAGKVTGNTQVTVNGVNAAVSGSVYGGGSLAPTQGNPVVTLTNGALTKVFGGGKAANVTGAPTVGITGGTVSTGVYGGCDSQGNVSGDITVNVTGGTIGSQASLNNNTTADIYGGGYGENTTTSGNVTVTFGVAPAASAQPEISAFPKIYGDIYGGSALGQVNVAGKNTTVNVLDGQLISKVGTENGFATYTGGNVFGGGLGETGSTTKGQVNGKVFVNIGAPTRALDPTNDSTTLGNAAIGGNVYGCNNTSGSPQDDVTVNIYRTYRKNTDQINHTPDSEWTYAIANVFGGGNRANYTASNKTANVNIFSCYNSIRRLFGGGNAAEAPNVHTTIQGGRFEEVFGGGNGEVSAANITGNVNLEIHGGTIGSFFAGSNQNGSIAGTSNVTIDQVTGCEDVNITEFYCGGKYADFIGDINATITCAQNMHVNNLYGGCKEAHVRHKGTPGQTGYEPGNIHLIVNGGSFDNVYGGSRGTTAKGADVEGSILLEINGGTITNAIFGGSNVKGAIGGSITVNVEQKTGADYCPLDVSTADVYGGGNQADYPGVPAPDSPITGTITHTSPYNYPEVNIKNATVKNVFGGGLNATVTGNPQIFIKKGSKVLGNVYGGGNMGEVNGNPRVIVNGKQTN